jgi:hypothetical protein
VLKLRMFALGPILLMTAAVVLAPAQGPLHKRIDFNISVPFELKKGKAVLPPGSYVLYQINATDPSLFALYPGDMSHSPIAIIHTTRIDYTAGHYPSHTRLLMDTEESWPQKYPVVEGFNIPGEDGWAVISAVTRWRGLNTTTGRSH